MNLLEFIGILSGLLSASAYIPYIRDVFAGKTQPQRASWLIWTVLTSIAFFSQFAKGATNSLWLPGLETVGLTIIFILSIKFGTGGLSKRDLLALMTAGIGLIFWYFTKQPTIALFLSIGIDAIGTAITVQKAYEEPESETISTWVLVSSAGILSMIAVGKLNIVLLAYPFYIFAGNGATALAMMLGEKPKGKRKKN